MDFVMSTTAIVPAHKHNPCDIIWDEKDLTQSNVKENLLFQLPGEVIWEILSHFIKEKSELKGAIRAVDFGRVSVYTHMLTHENPCAQLYLNDVTKFDSALEAVVDTRDEQMCDQIVSKAMFNEDFSQENGVYRARIIHAIFKRLINVRTNCEYFRYADQKRINFLTTAWIFATYLGTDHSAEMAFKCRTCQDAVKNFAEQALKNITIQEFKKTTYDLAEYSIVTTENRNIKMEEAIKLLHLNIYRKHDQKEFAAVQESLLSEGFFEEVKNGLSRERMDMRRQINEEMHELRGPNGFNGAIHEAYLKMMDAIEKRNHAQDRYVKTRGNLFDRVSQRQASSQFHNSILALKSAKKEFKHLNALLAILAVWKDGIIVSGKIVDIEADLQDAKLLTDTQAICQELKQFYQWLGGRPVTPAS
jgi:hypothetical protein